MGRSDEAIAEERRALELDPLSLIARHNLARALHYAHRNDDAIAEERRIVEMDTTFYTPHLLLGTMFLQEGHNEEAVTELQKALALSGGSFFALAELGHAQGRTGKQGEALKILERLKALSQKRYIPAYYFALVCAGLDEKDQTFAWLQKAYDERSDFLVLLKIHDTMASLHSDPRFGDLLRRVRLPQ